jgi:hypothetical protein
MKNGMQIVVDKVLKFVHDYSWKQNLWKGTKLKRKIFLFLFIWELAKHIMSKGQHLELKIVLPKLVPMKIFVTDFRGISRKPKHKHQ